METQKLSVKAFALAGGILWGSALLVVGLLNLALPGYGQMFLDMMSSVYFGNQGMAPLRSVLILTVVAFLDGTIAGFLFALIYNLCSCCCCKKKNE